MSYVNLSGTRLCDDDLASVDGLPDIDVLDLSGTLVTDAGLTHLCQLKRLQVLVIDGTYITDHGLTTLRQALPGVAIVISRTFVPTGPHKLAADVSEVARRPHLASPACEENSELLETTR